MGGMAGTTGSGDELENGDGNPSPFFNSSYASQSVGIRRTVAGAQEQRTKREDQRERLPVCARLRGERWVHQGPSPRSPPIRRLLKFVGSPSKFVVPIYSR